PGDGADLGWSPVRRGIWLIPETRRQVLVINSVLLVLPVLTVGSVGFLLFRSSKARAARNPKHT
ncbi:MAG: hypothetical protein PVI59_16935, partial [Anaerolineae bacterium]